MNITITTTAGAIAWVVGILLATGAPFVFYFLGRTVGHCEQALLDLEDGDNLPTSDERWQA